MEPGAGTGVPGLGTTPARSRLFRQFKNPPQPHMCIEERAAGAGPADALYINVLAWQKIASPERCSDPIPLYGGMQVPQSCGPNSKKPPLLVFAVMVNPEILRTSGKNAANPMDRDALVSLLCDFVEAMNPGLLLARNPVILKDRDLTGELKDVWLAVQHKRERERGMNQDFLYKVYDIDGVQNDETGDEDRLANSYRDNRDNQNTSNFYAQNSDTNGTTPPKSSKQILKNAGQLSEFDSGMNNYQLNQCSSALQNYIEARDSVITCTTNNTSSTQAYGQIMSTRENNHRVPAVHRTPPGHYPPGPGRTEANHRPAGSASFDDFSTISNGEGDYGEQRRISDNLNNSTDSYNFFPVFHTVAPPSLAAPALTRCQTPAVKSVELNNKQNKMNSAQNNGDNKDNIVDPMQKLVLHSTDNKICDNKKS